jgi:large subunit ribosomal protein L5
MDSENKMRRIMVSKVTVNMGVGPEPAEMKTGQKIIEKITECKAVQTKCKVRQPKWGIRPGLPIGLKVTLRGQKAIEFLKRAMAAKGNVLKRKSFDNQGNFGFGIHEYIDMPGVKYDPTLGVKGFDVLVTLERPGFRIKRRKIKCSKVGRIHTIPVQDAVDFMQKNFGAVIE